MLSVWSFTRHGRFNASRPRIAATSSIRLFVVNGSAPTSSRSLAPVRSKTAQPPGPGVPRHAPSVNISTSGRSAPSGNELARQLEDHALREVVGLLFGHVKARAKRFDNLPYQ